MLTDNGPTDDDLAAYTDDRDPTVHPIDTEALRRLADAATPGPWETSQAADEETTTWIEHHYGDVLNHDERGHGHMRENFAWMKRADAEFIAAARTAVPALLDLLAAAEHRATRAESQSEARRINTEYWKETALQERGAALDLLEQIKGRDQRIKAVRDVLDQAHDKFENADPAIIRRALDA